MWKLRILEPFRAESLCYISEPPSPFYYVSYILAPEYFCCCIMSSGPQKSCLHLLYKPIQAKAKFIPYFMGIQNDSSIHRVNRHISVKSWPVSSPFIFSLQWVAMTHILSILTHWTDQHSGIHIPFDTVLLTYYAHQREYRVYCKCSVTVDAVASKLDLLPPFSVICYS